MPNLDLIQSATELGKAIAAGTLDPVELTEGYLDAIKSAPEQAEIYTNITETRAMEEAKGAQHRAKHGIRRGPLDGIPISWKDLYDIAGAPCEGGTALLKGRRAHTDCALAARAQRAGLICLGKTHTTELAFSGLGLNPVTATPPNTGMPGCVPGGSSSGAAASVAYGLAAAGIGSDTGGSVRVPAAWNNLVGLKTTHGSLPMEGVLALARGFDTAGPLTQNVEDAAHIFAVFSGTQPVDLTGAHVTGMRFAVQEIIDTQTIAPEIRQAFEQSLDRIHAAGGHIAHIPLPQIDTALALSGHLFTPEAYAEWGTLIEQNPDKMFAPVRDRFLSGRNVSGAEYQRAWADLKRLRLEYHSAISGFDAVLTPTSPNLPPRRDQLLADDAYFVSENLRALSMTRIGNLMGSCALTVPTGYMACGLQILAPPHAEARLLRIGSALERQLSA